MKRLIALLLCGAATTAMADTRLSGIVRNTKGTPIASLDLHFYQREGKKFNHLKATTGTDGKWSINLPPGEWRGAANTDDLLAQGYFCGPGFMVCGEPDSIDCGVVGIIGWPPLWGGGEIIWTPIDDPGFVNVTIVPTRPTLTVAKPLTSAAQLEVSFETTTQDMTLVRQWRIEKSTDMFEWTSLQTVALSGTSPVIVPDPASVSTPVCFYRAVQVADIVPASP